MKRDIRNPLDMSDDTKKITVETEIRIFKTLDGEAQELELELFAQKKMLDKSRMSVYDTMKKMQLFKEKLKADPRGGKASEELTIQELYGKDE